MKYLGLKMKVKVIMQTVTLVKKVLRKVNPSLKTLQDQRMNLLKVERYEFIFLFVSFLFNCNQYLPEHSMNACGLFLSRLEKRQSKSSRLRIENQN